MSENLKKGVDYDEAPEKAKTEALVVGMNFPKPEIEKMHQGMSFPKPTTSDVALTMNMSMGQHNYIEDTHEDKSHATKSVKPESPLSEFLPNVVTQHMAEVSLKLNQNTHLVNEACSAMTEGLEQVKKQLTSMNRAPRKEKTGYSGSELSNFDIMASVHYDNCTFDNVTLIENANGPIEVAHLVLESGKPAELFAIWFSNYKHVVVGKIDGITKTKLYQAFLDVGIKFSKQFPQTRIPDVLYEMFGKHINLTQNVLSVPVCGGWFRRQYLHSKNFPYGNGRAFAKLPVMQKKIDCDDLKHEDILLYHNELVSIKDVADRKIIFLYPFLAILASLLTEANKKVMTVLNIVAYENVPLERVCRWFSVTAHEHMIPAKGNACEKTFLNTCTSVKDEVLLIDFRRSCQGSKHKKGNAKENQANLIRTFAGTHLLEKPIHPCGLVTFSDSLYSAENVVNILLGRKSVENEPTKSDTFAKVFGSFIRYVETNYDFVKEIICRKRNPKFVSSGVFGITLEIVNYFWASKGYSTWNIIDSRIDGSELKYLLNRKVFDQKELLDTFFKAMRKEAPNYKILQKLDKTDDEICIRYDKDWIWVPTQIFEEVCSKHGLAGYGLQIILAYESMGLLEPDTSSKAVTLQVCKKRFETYKFKNGAFDRIGISSFVDRGKEV